MIVIAHIIPANIAEWTAYDGYASQPWLTCHLLLIGAASSRQQQMIEVQGSVAAVARLAEGIRPIGMRRHGTVRTA